MCDLESLEAVAALCLATHDVQNLVDQLCSLGVVALGPVVTGAGLTEDEVVGAEKLTKWTGTNGIHGPWFKVDEDGTRDILVVRCLPGISKLLPRPELEQAYLVEVDVHTLKLEIGLTVVADPTSDSVHAKHSRLVLTRQSHQDRVRQR